MSRMLKLSMIVAIAAISIAAFATTSVVAAVTAPTASRADGFVRLVLGSENMMVDTCSDIDWEMINAILMDGIKGAKESMSGDDTKHRYLRSSDRTLQLNCKEKCKGYTPGMCLAPGCASYNNRNQAGEVLETMNKTLAGSEIDSVGDGSIHNLRQLPDCRESCSGTIGRCRKPGCVGYVSEDTPLDTAVVGTESEDSGVATLEEGSDGVRRLLLEANLRQLPDCRESCSGTIGRCRKPGCVGYVSEDTPLDTAVVGTDSEDSGVATLEEGSDGVRRTLLEAIVVPEGTPCTKDEIKYMNHQIDALIRSNLISPSCQRMLKPLQRHYTCYYSETSMQ